MILSKTRIFRNNEGYYSPTEGEALSHVIHEERVAARKKRLDEATYVLAWVNPKPYVEQRHNAPQTISSRRMK